MRDAKKTRKVYTDHYGPIPREPNGRAYEIHHIDGNSSNDDPLNLVALTIQEHYDLHYSQGDWAACLIISSLRLNKSPEEISDLSSKANLQRVTEGTHHFVGGDVQRRSNAERLLNGTHHFIGETNPSIIRVMNGTHHLLKREDGSSICSDNVKNGTHPTQHKWICPHCGLEGKNASAGKRWHFDNCRTKKCSESADTL